MESQERESEWDLRVTDQELHCAYERVSEEYERKSKDMLLLATDPHGADAFREASEEVAILWARLQELRMLLRMRLSVPRTAHDGNATDGSRMDSQSGAV